MKIRINRKSIRLVIFYILMLFSYFQFDSLNYLFTPLLAVYKIFHYISFLIILFLFIKNKKFSKIIVYMLAYLAILFFTSILNGQQVSQVINYAAPIVSLCLITDYGIRNHTKEYLTALAIILNLLIIINFATIILYPRGMYINSTGYKQNWILGYKNSHILYLLPCVVVNFILSFKNKGKLNVKSYIIFAICFISILSVNSSTGIVGIMIVLLYLIFRKFFDRIKLINGYSSLFIYLLSFVSIMILKVQNLFKFLIVDILKKDLTFTGRTYIWDSVLKGIKIHPLIGHGNVTYQYNKYIFTTHNVILDILYRSGIVGFLTYILILFEACGKLYKNRKDEVSRFLSIILLVYFVMMLTEAYNVNYYFFILVICSNIKYLKGGVSDE